MPFTPYHFGPGALAKAIAPTSFSFTVFALTQVVLDIEPLWYLIRWDLPVHRFWHTYLGATIVAIVCSVLGKPASQGLKTMWNRMLLRTGRAEFTVLVRTSWLASFTGAVSGAYSHIFLDSVYCSDFEPTQPWNAANPLFGVMNPYLLQGLCVLLLIIGVAGIVSNGDKLNQAKKG